MDLEELAARVVALERYAEQLGRATQQPLLDLLDWAIEEQVHDLGHTRGKLLALEAFCRAAIALVPDRERMGAALTEALARAEADSLVLGLPERSMSAALAALKATGEALRRDLGADTRADGQ